MQGVAAAARGQQRVEDAIERRPALRLLAVLDHDRHDRRAPAACSACSQPARDRAARRRRLVTTATRAAAEVRRVESGASEQSGADVDRVGALAERYAEGFHGVLQLAEQRRCASVCTLCAPVSIDDVGDLPVQRIALGVELAQPRQRIGRREQRPVAVVAHALAQILRPRVQVDHRAARGEVPAVLGGRAPRRRRSRARCPRSARELGDHLRLARAEAGFALDLEDHRDLHAAAALDLLVGIDEARFRRRASSRPTVVLPAPIMPTRKMLLARFTAAILRRQNKKRPGGPGRPRRSRRAVSANGQPLVDDARRDEDQQLGLGCVVRRCCLNRKPM